ncbi:protein phosphatase 1 regulatory subunit 35 isoform X2 [Rana temporaria]|uniref:protein phosphatase 1 regulatory subunit 35 isoform X2 n=1 Tax=Rana temporaria TaxID=8407 RepID=UPI001AAD72CF|nr:protein phosphatase 1 regulatory subunit 35 isoform X2 [Rana temporaria]
MSACEEESAVPAHRAPQPLPPDPEPAQAHPLLDITLTPDKGGGILRREPSGRKKGPRQVRFDVDEEASGVEEAAALPGGLSAPRMHSSEALKQEVRVQARREFDAQSAVRTELVRSYRMKSSVESEASRALNVCREQNLYRGLVSVEPPSEHIQRLTARQRKAEPREPQVPSADGPDIFAFTDSADRFTETPYLSVEGLPPLTLKSHTRPPHTTFSMFHKLGEWAS